MTLKTRDWRWSLSAIALAAFMVAAMASAQAPPAWSAQTSIQLTGVRMDEALRPLGANGGGLVASVTVSRLARPSTTGDFTVFITDDQGKRAGEVSCLAMRFLDGANPKQWVLLESSPGSMARSYKAMIDSGAAVVEATRNKPVEKGRYELVYVVGTSAKRGALTYGEDRRESARLAIGSFDIPWVRP
jgi:hypothetical protein